MTADTLTADPGHAADTEARVRGLPVTGWVLRQQRRGLLLWGLAVGAVAAIYVSFYPAMGDGDELQAMVDGLPEGLVSALGYDSIGSAAGYLESTVFGLLAPILLLVFALGAAARLVAGEEEDGALELELTAPVGRRRVLAERLLALVVAVVGLCLVVAAVSAVLVLALDMDVALSGIAAATLGLGSFVLAMSSVTFAVGAATGRRAVALGAGAGLAVVAYMADALAPLVEGAGWLATASPFAWYLGNDPLVEGVDVAGFAGLLLLACLATIVAAATFERRDVGV